MLDAVENKPKRFDKIILNKGGSGEKKVSLSEIHIPDLWHASQYLKEHSVAVGPNCAGQQVLDNWTLTKDLKKHIKEQQDLTADLIEVITLSQAMHMPTDIGIQMLKDAGFDYENRMEFPASEFVKQKQAEVIAKATGQV